MNIKKKTDSLKTLDELKRQKEELVRLQKEDKELMENEDTSPSDREAAETRVEAHEEVLRGVNTEIAEREKGKPLREKLKKIFKKHSGTVVSVVIAAGAVIEVMLSKLLTVNWQFSWKWRKKLTKKVDDKLKTLGDKVAAILPGLIGAIAKFVFNAAGKAISFLEEHTWLLVLAVTAFLIEKTIKSRRRR